MNWKPESRFWRVKMVMVVDMSPVSPEFTLISISFLIYWIVAYMSHGGGSFALPLPRWLCAFCLFEKMGWIGK